MMPGERRLSFSGHGLELEGAIHDGAGDWAALALHPHPQYGGDMDNHVVTAVCGALAARGMTTLRFNFRGAGRSEGSYDNGHGEAEDARNAARTLREAARGARLLLVGYSFGAIIAASVAAGVGAASLVLISPPIGMAGPPAIDPSRATLVVAGGRDPIAPADAVRALSARQVDAVVVDVADHSWWPGVDSLVSQVLRFVDSLPAAIQPPRGSADN